MCPTFFCSSQLQWQFVLVLLYTFSCSALALEPVPQCKKDFKGDVRALCLKALKDDPEAQLQIGRYYAGQVDPNFVNYSQAFYWHRRLARLALHLKLDTPIYTEVMYNTGVFYADGLGIKQDYKKARYWFNKAAQRGDDMAMFRLALMYSEGLGVLSDIDESLNWLKKAVIAGNLDAKVLLAQVYSEGKIVPQDITLSLKLLREAVEYNSPSAQFTLGNYYLHGLGVAKSRVMAKSLFSSACQGQLLEACRAYHDLDVQEENRTVLSPSSSPIE